MAYVLTHRDSAFNHFLLELASPHGTVVVRVFNETWQHMFLCSHALNGGVRINALEQTGVPGLLPCAHLFVEKSP